MRLLLAIVPVSRGFGFLIIDEDCHALDWGRKTFTSRNTCIERALDLIGCYHPHMVAIESHVALHASRAHRDKDFLLTVTQSAISQGVRVSSVTKADLDTTFKSRPRTNLHMANAVAKTIPELRLLLPRPRRAWESQPYYMPIFRAGQLALCQLTLDKKESRL